MCCLNNNYKYKYKYNNFFGVCKHITVLLLEVAEYKALTAAISEYISKSNQKWCDKVVKFTVLKVMKFKVL